MTKNEIYISFSDLWHTCKQVKKKLLVIMLACALLAIFYQIRKPLSYTSCATFKSGANQKAPSLSKIAESIFDGDGSQNFFIKSDPKALFTTRSVTEKLVKTLDLQATVIDGSEPGVFSRIGRNIAAEYYFYKYSSQIPPSHILSGNEIIPEKKFFTDYQPAYICKNVTYTPETYSFLSIVFVDSEHFQVYAKKQFLGNGKINEPFIWVYGQFTLQHLGHKNHKTIYISLIPLYNAAKGVAECLVFKADPKKNNFIKISCTHTNRYLAVKIVNGVMDAYRDYLEEIANQRSNKQISYLEKRHEYSNKKFEEILSAQIKSFEDNIDSGSLLRIENEVDFVTHTQTKYREKLNALADKLQILFAVIEKKENLENVSQITSVNLSTIINKAREFKAQRLATPGLDLESAYELQNRLNCDISKTDLFVSQCEDILTQLDDGDFQLSSLTTVLDDSVCEQVFKDCRNISLHLLDEKNRTPKEQERLKEDMLAKRRFLKTHVSKLKQVSIARKNMLQLQLEQIVTTLCMLLADEYELIQKELEDIHRRILLLPEKWISEKKLEFNTQVYTRIIESISKLIESKNIAVNLDFLESHPIDLAIPSINPNKPNILKKSILASCLAATVYLFAVFLITLFKGLRCSQPNLVAMGHQVFGTVSHTISKELLQLADDDLNAIRTAAHCLVENRYKKTLIQSKIIHPCAHLMAQALKIYGIEKILILRIAPMNYMHPQLSEYPPLKHIIITQMHYDELTIEPFLFRQEHLCSAPFEQLLETFTQKYDYIFIETTSKNMDLGMQSLIKQSDALIYLATDERYQNLKPYVHNAKPLAFILTPEKMNIEFETSIAFFKKHKTTLMLQIKQVEPLLENLKKRVEKSITTLKK